MENKATIYLADARNMTEIKNESVDLIITSPPYWNIKDYGVENQIGYGQSLHEYLKDLYKVWKETYRVLKQGRRMCINIGDQFARSIVYGRYKVIPLHAEIIRQAEIIGFDYMGAIIWQKKTTMNTSGGATVMGSYPYPPNGIVEIDYEFILIFKKPGKYKTTVEKEIKEKSQLSKEEWKEFFSGHWKFGGAKQVEHEAMFPDELPRRLIKMFSFVGETILDPFMGSGTMAKVALELDRNAIGYEINPKSIDIIKKKVLPYKASLTKKLKIVKRETHVEPVSCDDYVPGIINAKPLIDPKKFRFSKTDRYYKVISVNPDLSMVLDTGLSVKLAYVDNVAIDSKKKEKILNYLNQYIRGKKVEIKILSKNGAKEPIEVEMKLKNKINANKYILKKLLGKVEIWERSGF